MLEALSREPTPTATAGQQLQRQALTSGHPAGRARTCPPTSDSTREHSMLGSPTSRVANGGSATVFGPVRSPSSANGERAAAPALAHSAGHPRSPPLLLLRRAQQCQPSIPSRSLQRGKGSNVPATAAGAAASARSSSRELKKKRKRGSGGPPSNRGLPKPL